jgi:hypothetical protein
MVVLEGIEPTSSANLAVMPYKDTALPLSYRTIGREGGTRTHTELNPRDFKSRASNQFRHNPALDITVIHKNGDEVKNYFLDSDQ